MPTFSEPIVVALPAGSTAKPFQVAVGGKTLYTVDSEGDPSAGGGSGGGLSALGYQSSEARGASTPRFTRVTTAGPMLTSAMVGGKDLYIPCLTKAAVGAPNPYPTEPCRLYFSTDHDEVTGGISLVTAASMEAAAAGQWTDRGTIYIDSSVGEQTEGPSVVWNERTGLYHMYYQQLIQAGVPSEQQTILATSPNGVNTWTRVGTALSLPGGASAYWWGTTEKHSGYAHIQRLAGLWFTYALRSGGAGSGEMGLYVSRNGIKWMPIHDGLTPDPHTHRVTGLHMSWNGARVLRWNGELFLIAGITNDGAGGVPATIGGTSAWPLAGNLRTVLGAPSSILPGDPSEWETEFTNPGRIGAVMEDDGKLYGLLGLNDGVGQDAIGLAVAE